MPAVVGAVLACAAPAAAPALAAAQPNLGDDLAAGYVPWPELLPGLPAGPAAGPHPAPGCPHASLECVDGLIRRLGDEWRAQDAACSHRALFSYAYLQITRGLRDELARGGLFRYPEWFIDVIQEFSDIHFATEAAADAGEPVPGAWRIYYDEMAKGDGMAGQDILLASNAHTNHDLPYAYAAMGLRAADGSSHKPDHDAVNLVNARVFGPLTHYIADHYDPEFSLLAPISPVAKLPLLQLVQVWRENAWRQAERLVSAKTPAARQRVEDQIETSSTLWARFIVSLEQPGYRGIRDAYCATHHENG